MDAASVTHLFDITLSNLVPDSRLVVCLIHRLEQLVLVALCDVGLFLEFADFGRRINLALTSQLCTTVHLPDLGAPSLLTRLVYSTSSLAEII